MPPKSQAAKAAPQSSPEKDLETVGREAADILRRDIEKTVADARDAIGQAAQALTQAGRALAEEANSRRKAAVGVAGERARTLAEDVEREVRDNPIGAIGVAVGVGLVLGLLVGRRH